MGASGTIFADEFDVDSGAWTAGGTGDWVVADGERSQTDATAGLAFDYVPSMANLSDYHIRSRMRQIAGDVGGAMEIDFRISATAPAQQYFCNWEPNSGNFLIMISTAGFAATVIETVPIDVTTLPSYDPFASFTMNIDVIGTEFHCWLEEIPEADLTVNDGSYLTGAFGLKNYAMATAYDFIHVTAVP